MTRIECRTHESWPTPLGPALLLIALSLVAAPVGAEQPGETGASADEKGKGAVQEEECGRGVKKWVSVRFVGRWPKKVVDIIVQDLSAGLEADGMQACVARSHSKKGVQRSREPVSQMRISRDDDEVTIEVEDFLTDKRVARDVALGEAPGDSEALVLAVAAEELLRATWAELSLAQRKSGTSSPAAEGAATAATAERDTASVASAPFSSGDEMVDDRSGAPEVGRVSPEHQLSLSFAVEHMTGGVTLLGANMGYAFMMGEVWSARVWAGLRKGLDRSARFGQVDSEAVVGGAALDFFAVRSPSVRFGPTLGVQAAGLHLVGEPDARTIGGSGWAPVAFARAGALLSFGRQPAVWTLSATLGAPLATFEATENGHVVHSASGLEAALQFGGGFQF